MSDKTKPNSHPRKRQRPYDADAAKRICGAIAEGASLTAACSAEGIQRCAFYEWCDAQPELAIEYARARERQNEGVDDDLRELVKNTDNENARANETKFRILTWIAGKRSSKKFGDKVGIEHSGKDGGPLKVEVEVIGGVERDQNRTD